MVTMSEERIFSNCAILTACLPASLAKSRRLGLVAIIPDAIVIATTHADEKDIKKITALCDEVEELINNHEDHTQKDIEFHTAIAMSSKNVVVPRLIPVINSSIPLFVEKTGGYPP